MTDVAKNEFASAFAKEAGSAAGSFPIPEVPSGDLPPPPSEDPPPAETPPAETPPAETPPAETPPAEGEKTEDVLKELTNVIKEAVKPQPPAPPAETPPAKEEVPQVPLYTDAEKQILAGYEKTWPDVAEAEMLKRRAEYHDLTTFIFSEVSKHLSPISEQVAQLVNTMHFTQVKEQVPNYSETLESEVAAWIDTQPGYLQAGMKQVMQSGSSDEVADLIGRYREATGTKEPPAPKLPEPPKQTELSSAAKQAAESLAPVGGDRSDIPTQEDPMDFKSEFQRYSKM